MRHALVWVLAAFVLMAGARPSAAFPVRLRSRAFDPSPGVAEAAAHLAARAPAAGHVFLQLRDPTSADDRARLAERGIDFLEYVPDHTWLVSTTIETVSDPVVQSLVRWAAPLEPADRMHPRVSAGVIGPWAREGREIRLTVRTFRDVPPVSAREAFEALGATIVQESLAFHSFELAIAPEALLALASLDDVLWVRETLPPLQEDNDSARGSIRADEVETVLGLDGTGVVIALWDAGRADPTHPDIAGRLATGDTLAVTPHATHVTGTLIGTGEASELGGGAPQQWRGFAPAASVVSFDWLDPIAEHEEAIVAFSATVSANPWSEQVSSDLGNCEIYGDYDFGAPEYDAVVRGLFGAPITVIRSAGNERNDTDCGLEGWPFDNFGVIPPPATAKNVITVGATHSDTDLMTNFSSWGPVDDGRLKPELVAPGCQGGIDFGITSPVPGGLYEAQCGTSMAVGALAGAVALLDEAADGAGGGTLDPALVKALLVNTARDRGPIGPDYMFGFGELDARGAVEAFQEAAFVQGSVSQPGAVSMHAFFVPFGVPALDVTLAWSDAPAVPLANPTLVNDLDLVLIDPRGDSHAPWQLDPASPELPATRGANHRDVVEQVSVVSPRMGWWTAVVRAETLPVGPQPYALATPSADPCSGIVRAVPGDYATIQQAITASEPCDTVRVAPGLYAGPILVDRPVVLQGIGPAFPVIEGDDLSRVITITADATVEGFIITGGAALGVGLGALGGGMAIIDASATVRSCRFTENFALAGGGGLAMTLGTLVLENCTFLRDGTLGTGGAVYVANGVGANAIRGNVFAKCTATGAGGGVALLDTPFTIVSNTFVRNEAGTGGGGAAFLASTGLVHRNIFATNIALLADAIACEGTETVTCNDFWENGEPGDPDCVLAGSNLFEDPVFCDEANESYALDASSPCAPPHVPAECGLIGALPVECATVDVPAETLPRVFAVAATPNPSRGSVLFRVELPESRPVRATIFDVAGRRVRTLELEASTPGVHLILWDGRDRSGNDLSPGLYFYRVEAGADAVGRRLVLLP